MALTVEEKKRIYEEEKIRQEMQGKSVAVAFLLSFFFPGLGDLYCGKWVTALFFFALNLVTFFLMFLGIGFLVAIPVWITGLISACLSASKSNRQGMKKLQKSLEQDGEPVT